MLDALFKVLLLISSIALLLVFTVAMVSFNPAEALVAGCVGVFVGIASGNSKT